jgi:hypothetical protein
VAVEEYYNSLDAAVRWLDAASGIAFGNLMVLNDATVTGDADMYRYMPKKGLFLILFTVVGLSAGIILMFLAEYTADAPRLSETFCGMLPGSPAMAVSGARGWNRLLATLHADPGPAVVAVVERRRWSIFRGGFTRALAKAARRARQKAFILFAADKPGTRIRGAASQVVTPPDLTALDRARACEIAGDQGTDLVLVDFPAPERSASSYLMAGRFDRILYVVRDGEVSMRDIDADIRFMTEQGWQGKIVGVFYV